MKSRLQQFLFNGLFWKIFAAIWLTNLAVLFAASFFIISKIEYAAHLEKHEQFVEYLSEKLANRYERKRSPLNIQFNHGRPDQPQFGLRVEDPNGNVVVIRGRDVDEPTPIIIEVEAISGKRYTAYADLPPPPPFYQKMLIRIMSLRLLLILMASAIASALISWRIAKPLKQLSQYNQHFAVDVKATKLPSALRKRRDEIGNLARETQAMATQVDATLKNQQQLLHDVSHELRAPLARLQVAIGLLEQSSTQNTHLDTIQKQCDRIHALIQEILDFSRLKQCNEKQQRFDLIELLEDCVINCQAIAPKRQFVSHYPDSVLISGYPDAMYSALENIIGNAHKYSPEDTPIDISVSQSRESITICVSDAGVGVSPEDLDQLIQPFYRGLNHTNENGFGLGLSIAARAVAKHQGQLHFKHNKPTGLTVEIVLKTL